jgi:hypothetical protein
MLKSGFFVVVLPTTNDGIYLVFKHSRVVHHNLEHLEIRTEGEFGEFFGGLTLSRLRDLSIMMGYLIDAEDPCRMWPQTQFMELLARSGCSLDSLALFNADITPEELVPCLPSLRNLLLSSDASGIACVTDEVLRLLSYWPAIQDAPPLCPKLINIKLWGSLFSSDGVLADMIESRWSMCRSNNLVLRPNLMVLMLKRSSHLADIARLGALDDHSLAY